MSVLARSPEVSASKGDTYKKATPLNPVGHDGSLRCRSKQRSHVKFVACCAISLGTVGDHYMLLSEAMAASHSGEVPVQFGSGSSSCFVWDHLDLWG